MPGQSARNDKPNYRLLGAIVLTPDASYFFKLTGPEKTVAAASKGFDSHDRVDEDREMKPDFPRRG